MKTFSASSDEQVNRRISIEPAAIVTDSAKKQRWFANLDFVIKVINVFVAKISVKL